MKIETTDEFEAGVRRLRKTYRRVNHDVRKLSTELLSGSRPQDNRLRNMGGMIVYKARLPNTSASIGARGGFRVVYRVVEDRVILLMLIWSKTQTADIPDSEIRRVANQY